MLGTNAALGLSSVESRPIWVDSMLVNTLILDLIYQTNLKPEYESSED